MLTAEQLQQIARACNVRDRAIVLFMADSGLRREETVDLNWGNVDMQSGLVRMRQGKGKKDRSAVIGAMVGVPCLPTGEPLNATLTTIHYSRHAAQYALQAGDSSVSIAEFQSGQGSTARRTPCAGPSLSYPFALEWMYCTCRPRWGKSLLK